MRHKPSLTAVLLLITLVVSQNFGPFLSAQTAPPSADQLDQLLAPVALYPDSLLSQITTASTNPQEILDVNTWLQQNPDLPGPALTDAAQKQGFDPAFIALVNFPDVLDMMAEHVDDYAAIGEAFLSDQGSVTEAIQRLRAQAYASGALRTNSQQQVEIQQPAGQTIYVIQPANPQIVYVPQYDPTIVYVRPSNPVVAASFISFGVGIGIGALLVDNQPWGWGGWGWNWGSRRAYYNHGYWGGWSNPYRPPRPTTDHDRSSGQIGRDIVVIGAIVRRTIDLRIVPETVLGTVPPGRPGGPHRPPPSKPRHAESAARAPRQTRHTESARPTVWTSGVNRELQAGQDQADRQGPAMTNRQHRIGRPDNQASLADRIGPVHRLGSRINQELQVGRVGQVQADRQRLAMVNRQHRTDLPDNRADLARRAGQIHLLGNQISRNSRSAKPRSRSTQPRSANNP